MYKKLLRKFSIYKVYLQILSLCQKEANDQVLGEKVRFLMSKKDK